MIIKMKNMKMDEEFGRCKFKFNSKQSTKPHGMPKSIAHHLRGVGLGVGLGVGCGVGRGVGAMVGGTSFRSMQ